MKFSLQGESYYTVRSVGEGVENGSSSSRVERTDTTSPWWCGSLRTGLVREWT